jgi:hypothetical protein
MAELLRVLFRTTVKISKQGIVWDNKLHVVKITRQGIVRDNMLVKITKQGNVWDNKLLKIT